MESTILSRTEERIPPEARPVVVAHFGLMLESRAFASDSVDDPWTFAIEREHLLAAGHGDALELMLQEGWVMHLNGKRTECKQPLRKEDSRQHYLLTESGLAVAVASRRREWAAKGPLTPVYEPTSGRLSAFGVAVAPLPTAFAQRRLLTAWQEDNWGEWLDNPLPETEAGNAAKQFKDAIYGLNRQQHPPLLRFHYETRDDGEGAWWEWLA